MMPSMGERSSVYPTFMRALRSDCSAERTEASAAFHWAVYWSSCDWLMALMRASGTARS